MAVGGWSWRGFIGTRIILCIPFALTANLASAIDSEDSRARPKASSLKNGRKASPNVMPSRERYGLMP